MHELVYFVTYGGWCIINLDDNYDLKFVVLKYVIQMQKLKNSTNNANRTDRHFGFEDALY